MSALSQEEKKHLKKQLYLFYNKEVGSDDGTRALFVWKEIRVSGENPRGRAGESLTFPHMTPGGGGEHCMTNFVIILFKSLEINMLCACKQKANITNNKYMYFPKPFYSGTPSMYCYCPSDQVYYRTEDNTIFSVTIIEKTIIGNLLLDMNNDSSVCFFFFKIVLVITLSS